MALVSLSAEAKQDLIEILFYLREKDGQLRAEKLFAILKESITGISEDPLRWPKYRSLENGIIVRRKIVSRSFSILYIVKDSNAIVQRVWHNARKPLLEL